MNRIRICSAFVVVIFLASVFPVLGQEDLSGFSAEQLTEKLNGEPIDQLNLRVQKIVQKEIFLDTSTQILVMQVHRTRIGESPGLYFLSLDFSAYDEKTQFRKYQLHTLAGFADQMNRETLVDFLFFTKSIASDNLHSDPLRDSALSVSDRLLAEALETGQVSVETKDEFARFYMEIVRDQAENISIRTQAIRRIRSQAMTEKASDLLGLLQNRETLAAPLDRVILSTLGEWTYQPLFPTALEIMESTADHALFSSGAYALGNLGNSGIVRPFLGYIDLGRDSRFACRNALNNNLDMILEGLGSPETEEVEVYLRASWHIQGDPDALTAALTDILNFPVPEVRLNAAKRLVRNLDPETFSMLIERLGADPDSGIRRYVRLLRDRQSLGAEIQLNMLDKGVDNRPELEVGDAVFQELETSDWVPWFWKHGHAALYYGLVYEDEEELDRVIDSDIRTEVFPWDTGVNFDRFAKIWDDVSLDYYGEFYTESLSWSDRQKILRTAEQLVSANIGYPNIFSLPAIDYGSDLGETDRITIDKVDALRCDGMVEYCYEFNGLDVWDQGYAEGDHFDISHNKDWADEHNNTPEASHQCDREFSPMAQYGGCSNSNTRFVDAPGGALPRVFYQYSANTGMLLIDAYDEHSGIYQIDYKIGTGEWVESQKQQYYPASNRHGLEIPWIESNTFHVRVKDNAGNFGEGQIEIDTRPIDDPHVVSTMDFEDGGDGQVIRSSIAGMFFTTTEGFDWIYGDKSTGYYNIAPYGDYVCNGNFFAWLGPNQGAGRIDFTGSTARSVSMKTSTATGLYLEAFDASGLRVDSDYVASNVGTGQLATLSVSGESISHVLVHDSGNYWLVDDLVVEDLLRVTSSYLGDMFTTGLQVLDLIDQGQSLIYSQEVNAGSDLELILNWAGSELGVIATKPNGDRYGEWRSGAPPLITWIENADPGMWNFEVVAYDVPHDDYPFALVVGASEPPTDETPPIILINSPVASVRYSDSMPVFFEFVAEDPESGASLVQGSLDGMQSIDSGQAVTVDAGSSHIFTVTATNGAGLVSTLSIEFSVLDFEWLAPLADLGEGSPFLSHASRTIPVKFRVYEENGDFVVPDSLRVVLENTGADFALCTNLNNADTCIRIDYEDEEVKYIVNFHTNPKRGDYGIVRGDSYTLKVLVDGLVFGTREVVFPSFPVSTSHATGFLVPGETQAIEWSSPEGASLFSSSVYLTTNGGATWDKIGEVDGSQTIFDVTVPEEVVSEAQIMVISMSSLGIIHGVSGDFSVGLVSNVPDGSPIGVFSLEQNVPNPFNPTTAINFSLPHSCGVDLGIFDLSGRKIRTILSGQVLDSGTHQVIWDGADNKGISVATGMYFYRLEADGHLETKRMMLVK